MTKPNGEAPNVKLIQRTAQGRVCGHPKSNGEPCKQAAGLGTDHLGWGCCKFHGGTSQSHRNKANKDMAREAVRVLGLDIKIDPARALLEELWRTAGHVAWLRNKIDEFGDDLLYLTEQGMKPRAFLDVYQAERRHLAKVASMALAAGVAERQVKIAEEQGALVAMAIKAILQDLGLTEEQQAQAPSIVRRHLSAIPTEEAS